MSMTDIFRPQENDYETLTNVWEASVRATHDFLSEADIAWLRPRIRNDYLHAVELIAFDNENGDILGFAGVADNKIEMLFVAPHARGQGVGKALLRHAVKRMKVAALDVNEQNPQARGFYEHLGFEVIGRSPLDSMNRPFPLLHMRLKYIPD
ncbi:MAG: GNAT family N-acetyltransferase [Comamonadaceae bacterium SCN 68-20]|nr:MAG: GNAT family N-acetyltransferase [Comamonadaceae bacterium SCN 68-20]OJX05717.1 MAG: GNAT family N-acetyltransferase [Burkholderiales bacterium 68-20]